MVIMMASFGMEFDSWNHMRCSSLMVIKQVSIIQNQWWSQLTNLLTSLEQDLMEMKTSLENTEEIDGSSVSISHLMKLMILMLD